LTVTKLYSHILLKDGKATCYTTHYDDVRDRLVADYAKESNAEYLIVQVVATVAPPGPPLISSLHED
jgi:hypothetical protein